MWLCVYIKHVVAFVHTYVCIRYVVACSCIRVYLTCGRICTMYNVYFVCGIVFPQRVLETEHRTAVVTIANCISRYVNQLKSLPY